MEMVKTRLVLQDLDQKLSFMNLWNGKFEHFCILQPTVKQEAMNGGLDLNNSVETSCPLGHTYDADIHDAIAHLRILDGSLPAHPTHGRSVNFFAEVGRPKY
jgi:hypothetical protein